MAERVVPLTKCDAPATTFYVWIGRGGSGPHLTALGRCALHPLRSFLAFGARILTIEELAAMEAVAKVHGA